jgi:hypothetical protein
MLFLRIAFLIQTGSKSEPHTWAFFFHLAERFSKKAIRVACLKDYGPYPFGANVWVCGGRPEFGTVGQHIIHDFALHKTSGSPIVLILGPLVDGFQNFNLSIHDTELACVYAGLNVFKTRGHFFSHLAIMDPEFTNTFFISQ